MVYRFIATTLFNGNKRLTMHSYREQMRNHNGRQYHLQSGIGRQATGNIVYFRKADYYQEHPFIEFDTVYGDAKYEVFGAFTIDVVNDTSFIYNQYIDMDEDTYNRYVDQVISRSDVDSGIRPAYGEQLLTLSTCEYSSANGRYVVVARRVRD